MRKLTILTLSAVFLEFAGAAMTPASAAPLGNVATTLPGPTESADSSLENVGWRRGYGGYGYYGGYYPNRYSYGGYYPRYRYSYGGYYPRYRYSYGGYSPYYYSSPYYYGGPSIYFGFGGHRHHGHWRRW
jgi:hypothetical protein